MNKIERVVYDLVKSNPWIKNSVRNIYQQLFDLLPRKKNIITGNIELKEGYFFGFHDISPFSSDEKKVLANKPKVFLNMPSPEDELEVGYFNFEGAEGKIGEFVSLTKSKAWNHHKGCRLQWLSDSEFIFNTSFQKVICSEIYNIKTGKSQRIDYPIDTIHKQTRKATSFSYERLENLMPGYGYPFKDNSYLSENVSHKTGVFLVDLDKNQQQLLVSLKDLVDEIGDENLEIYRHYVTHSEFSHDGRYISFLHRWVGDDVMKRWSRLVIYDLENKSFFALPTTGMVSHYVWNNKNQIVAYCSVNNQDGHVIFNIPDVNTYKIIAQDKLNSDGHQSFITDEIFITDTYPDKYRTAKIYKVNSITNDVSIVASVYSPKKYQSKLPYNHIACDLHPRVSPTGRYVCFDTVYTGIRSLAIMNIN